MARAQVLCHEVVDLIPPVPEFAVCGLFLRIKGIYPGDVREARDNALAV